MQMNGLILHCGAAAVTRSELYALPEPEPMGRFHAPIHHADFLEELEGVLVDKGFEIRDQAFGVTAEGARAFGVMSVVHQALRNFEGGEAMVGWRGAHDQSFPRAVSSGSRVFVCDNLAFNGDAVMHTKQTTNMHLRLPLLLDDMVDGLSVNFQRQVEQFDNYRLTQLSDPAASQVLIEMGRRNIINWSELGKVNAEWIDPMHEEHAEDGNSVWRMFNAATEVMKLRNPDHPRLPGLAAKTVALHELCDLACE
jgi:hypothetical protein